ncbi:MAG TPA: cytochrome c1 [Steroidobacteraceae bacterium]|jgi:ubiquinol-cytochrome c reductase cytochrome c1 subunit|nr:cytochrome c1 [Steroidobacteraceae bacterium]
MRTETRRPAAHGRTLLATALLATALCAAPLAGRAAEEAAGRFGADWESWHAGTTVSDLASVQRGARNFASYCLGCHSLKYERWSRLAADLKIPLPLLSSELLPPGAKAADYILTAMPAADAESWFGKVPPDLSLMRSARGKDYLYQFLMTFYLDPTTQTGANNLALPTTAMPDILSEVEGLKKAVFRTVERPGPGGTVLHEEVFDHFEPIAPGRMSEAEFEGFVRDTVNFLDYVSEPTQLERRQFGVWVVLFLLVFTWLTWLVKREYWKDVH